MVTVMYLHLETLQANGALTVQPNPDGTVRFLTRDGSFVDLGPDEVGTLCAILSEWHSYDFSIHPKARK